MAKKGNITKEMIEQVAELAHLTLKKGEVNKFKSQLANIFDYVEGVAKVQTSGAKATRDVTGLDNVTRPDQINKDVILSHHDALSQARSTHEGYFLVKSVFDQND